MPDLVTPIAAFALGLGLARANSCTVASARRLVLEGRADWLLGLAVAIAWAGLTVGAIALFMPQVVKMPATLQVSWPVILGAMIMGVGATVNRGCFLGSVAALGRGNLGYLFTLVGIAIGLALAPAIMGSLEASPLILGTPVPRSPLVLLLGSVIFVPLAILGALRWWRHRHQPMLALILVGIAGGTVYACNPDWSYSSGLYRVAASGISPNTALAEIGALAVVAGVVVSALAARTFRLALPTPGAMLARMTGGFLMAAGALFVPGGNDTLMLWTIPGLALYGVVAYGVMIVTIAALLAAGRQLMSARAQPTEERV